MIGRSEAELRTSAFDAYICHGAMALIESFDPAGTRNAITTLAREGFRQLDNSRVPERLRHGGQPEPAKG